VKLVSELIKRVEQWPELLFLIIKYCLCPKCPVKFRDALSYVLMHWAYSHFIKYSLPHAFSVSFYCLVIMGKIPLTFAAALHVSL
jgi:hypothetical protein